MVKVFLILGLCALALVFAFAPHVFPVTTDSIIYISAAEHIRQGEGLIFTNVFVEPAGQDTLPLSIHPPGYPFMVAAVSFLGLDAQTAATLLPRLFFCLLPVGFFPVLGHVMPRKPAMVTAGACTFLFANLSSALRAWSDIPFLFLSLIAFFFTFKAVKTRGSEQWVSTFFAGLFTGICLLTRNVGYALLIAEVLGLLLMPVFRVVTWKRLVSVTLVFAAAFLVPMLPFLIRNSVVLGRLSAFRYPPSNHPLSVNLADTARGLGRMVLANPGAGGILFVLIAGMMVWFLAAAPSMVRTDKRGFICAAVLVLYFLGGTFMLVLARTTFFMPEAINERYLIQYAWIIIAGMGACVTVGLAKLKRRGLADTKGAVVLVLTVYLSVQVFSAVDFLFLQKRILRIAQTVEAHVPVLSRVPEGRVIVSNVMDMTAFFSGREVRLLNGYLPYGLTRLLGPERDFAVLIFKERNEDFRSYLYPLSWLDPQGYRRVHEDRDAVLWFPEQQSSQ